MPINRILKWLIQRRILCHTLIRIVLTVPYRSIRSIRLGIVFIRQDMLRRIPSTETQVEAAHECNRLVNDAELFMLFVSCMAKDESASDSYTSTVHGRT